ncbi:hypothetical protein KSS87_014063 [Heliosperma pusillum]|nr:hypothetical protein KSS87_014063 [Heliosperma pusillum]
MVPNLSSMVKLNVLLSHIPRAHKCSNTIDNHNGHAQAQNQSPCPASATKTTINPETPEQVAEVSWTTTKITSITAIVRTPATHTRHRFVRRSRNHQAPFLFSYPQKQQVATSRSAGNLATG